MIKRIPVVAAGILVAGLGIGGLAYAGTSAASSGTANPAPASSPAPGTGTGSAKAAKPGHPARSLLARAIHADAILKGKGGTFHTYQEDRGSLDSVSPTASPPTISLTRADHVVVSAVLQPTTRFKGLAESQLKAGDQVLVVQRDGKAVLVVSRAPKPTTPKATSPAAAPTAT